jgi:hypothetical protein
MTKRLILFLMLAAGLVAQNINVASITPSTFTAGTSVPFTATGTNLSSATSLILPPGITASGVVYSGTITGTLIVSLAAVSGYYFIAKANSGGYTSSAIITVTPPIDPTPTLSGISPSTGKAGTSVPVTISGTGFVNYSVNLPSGITYSGLGGSTTSATLTLIIGAGTVPGPKTVTFSTNGGTSNGVTFTVTQTNTRRVILVN